MDQEAKDNKERILEALRVTVLEIMNTMVMTEVIYAGMETKKFFQLNRPVGGLVLLQGSHDGMIGVSCDIDLLKAIVSGIIGLPVDDLENEDLLDGASELANMVGGGMKTKAKIPGVVLSPPMAILGSDYMAEWKTDRPTEVLTFQMEIGTLQVHTSL